MIIAIVIILLIVIYFIYLYNSLVTLKNKVENAQHQIETQLQRRFDLIPNLVETVKGYAAHEKETLQNVVEARNSFQSASTIEEKVELDNTLTQTLKSLFAISEAYPDLKANTNFLELQEELTATENKIAFSRQYYNDIVTKYNTALEVFPKNIVAGIM